MISEGSCDTEDWSNDTENSALHHKNKSNLKIYCNKKTFQNITVLTVIVHSIEALVNIRDFFQKYKSKYHNYLKSQL